MTRREAIEILTRHADCLTDTPGRDALHAALAIAVADMAKVHALTKRSKKAYLRRRKARVKDAERTLEGHRRQIREKAFAALRKYYELDVQGRVVRLLSTEK